MAARDDALVDVLRSLEGRGQTLTADDVQAVLDGREVEPPRPPQTPEGARRAVGETMLAHMRRNGIGAARKAA
jgi:hypothetical protein